LRGEGAPPGGDVAARGREKPPIPGQIEGVDEEHTGDGLRAGGPPLELVLLAERETGREKGVRFDRRARVAALEGVADDAVSFQERPQDAVRAEGTEAPDERLDRGRPRGELGLPSRVVERD